jgi:nicotinic acid mononucleotide adenylyltransferase
MIPAVITTGRFNPVTRGHTVLIQILIDEAKRKNAKPLIFIIDAEKTGKDKNRNPLTGSQRLEILKSLYPNVTVDVVSNPVEALDVLDVQGMSPIVWIAGSDRVSDYRKLLDYVDIKTCEVLEVDRDIGEAAGVSATIAKNAVKANDLKLFKAMMPENLNNQVVADIFEKIREQLGVIDGRTNTSNSARHSSISE